MSLEDLQKKIYKPEFEMRKDFKLENTQKKRVANEWEEEIKRKKIPPKKKKKIFIISICIIIIFILTIGWLVWRGLNSFNTSDVSLLINGPEKTVSGDEVIYTLDFKNNTRLALTNLKLIVYYPEGSVLDNKEGLVQSFDLDDIAAGQESKLKIPVRIIGLKNDKRKIRVELNYQPSAIMSRFASKANFTTTIISVPLVLNFDMPERLINDQSFDFSLSYINQAEIDFDNVVLKMKYPIGFVFDSATPEPAQDNNIWSLGSLIGDQNGKILINGAIKGEQGDTRIFKAKLGFMEDEKFINYAEAVDSLDIIVSPLFVSQTINGLNDFIAYAGQRLDYIITYKNTSNTGIQDVIITSKLNGKALDMSNLELGNGSFDGNSNIITWNAGNVSDLSYIAPQEQGHVAFSVKIKDTLPANSLEDKNFKIFNTIDIDSSQTPLALKEIDIAGQSITETKIASQLSLKSMGYYYDDIFANSGSIPPKIGQTTEYTIKWQIINTGNDLENVEVSAFLPPHVKWQDKINPANSNLEYNTDTGLLVWKIDSLSAATGALLPVKQVAFQIAITPGQAHLDSLVELVGQSVIKANDTFTNIELINTKEAIDTNLPNDSRIEWQDGIVIE